MSRNHVIGHRVVKIKKLPKRFIEEVHGWERDNVWAIELDNGTIIYASQDEEGNGPGSMFVTTGDGDDYYLSGLKDES